MLIKLILISTIGRAAIDVEAKSYEAARDQLNRDTYIDGIEPQSGARMRLWKDGRVMGERVDLVQVQTADSPHPIAIDGQPYAPPDKMNGTETETVQ